jgi:hypothetical protein
MSFLKKYWLAISVLLVSCGYFLLMAAPDYTWANVDCDSFHYLSGAENFVVTPSQGSPFYNMINVVLVWLPFPNFQTLCASSAIYAGFTAMFLFLMAKRYTKSNLIALLAPLCFCASAIVVSQATILKQYSLLTMLSVLAIYLHFIGKEKSKYIVLMLGVATHHLIVLPLAVIFLYDMVKHKKEKTTIITKKMLIPLIGGLFYAWIPLMNRFPYTLIDGEHYSDYIEYWTRNSSLIGGLAVFSANGLQRLQDSISMLGYSFGACWVLIVYSLIKFKKSIKDKETGILVFLWAVPLLYYITDMDSTVYTYTMMAFAFGGLLVVKGAEWIKNTQHKRFQYGVPVFTGICCVAMMITNTFYFDIGRNNDVDLEAKRYQESLTLIPDDACIWAGFASAAYPALQYYNDIEWHNITMCPLMQLNETRGVELATEAWENDKLYIIDYEKTSDGFLKMVNRKVTNETYAVDWQYIEDTKSLTKPYENGMVKIGWSNPIDLINGKLSYQKWLIGIQSNLTAGYVFMWAVVGYFTPSLTRTIFGKKIKDKRKLRIIMFVMLLVLMGLLATMLMSTGTPMFWMKGN